MLHFALKSVCMCMLCFFTFVKLEPSSEPIQYNKYRTLDEINEFIENILSTYNDATSEIIIGKSFERRSIKGVKISTKTEGLNETRPGIVVDGGIHAREWVSTVAVLYTLHQLVSNSSYSDLLQGLDWYIIPMLNPDGYVFSMDPKGNRQWRKNMAVNHLSECRGVDLNRNFDFAWGGEGSSDNPCDWNYRGPYPFSEPESRALADFMKSLIPEIKMYLTLHSAAQAIIYPWGFTDARPQDWEELDRLAKLAVQEMYKVNQTSYLVGPTTETVGIGAGGSDDWAKGSAGVKYVYTMELPGLGYPEGGFHPPESDLQLISEETLQGIRVFAGHLLNSTTPSQESRQKKPEELPAYQGGSSAYPAIHSPFVNPLQWYNPLPFGYTYLGK